jgi:uncharacterized protein YoaH (UPF0181 family)
MGQELPAVVGEVPHKAVLRLGDCVAEGMSSR